MYDSKTKANHKHLTHSLVILTDISLIDNGAKPRALFTLVPDRVIPIWKSTWYNYLVALSMSGFSFNEIGKHIHKYVHLV